MRQTEYVSIKTDTTESEISKMTIGSCYENCLHLFDQIYAFFNV